MSVHESLIGMQWITATLAGDATLASYAPGGIYRSLAPTMATPPYIILSFQAGSDVMTINDFRLMVSALFLVKAVGRASDMTAIASAAARIDDLLGSPPASGAVAHGAVLSSSRESPFMQDEQVGLEQWVNLGGKYRLLIQQLP